MTAQEKALDAFRAFAENTLSESVTVGLLPQQGGISMQIVAGRREYTSLNRQTRRIIITLDMLCKNKSQSKAYESMCAVANACDSAELAEPIVNAQAVSEPVFVGKDGDFWIYSLTVSLRIMI